jgi:fructokinase
VYRPLDCNKTSEQDLAWLYPNLDVKAACRSIVERGPRLVIATLGADGAFGLTSHAEAHGNAEPVTVVDTIGAGDTFGAALLAWLQNHHLLSIDLCLTTCELEAALTFACRAASWSCTRSGAQSPTRRDL